MLGSVHPYEGSYAAMKRSTELLLAALVGAVVSSVLTLAVLVVFSGQILSFISHRVNAAFERASAKLDEPDGFVESRAGPYGPRPARINVVGESGLP